MSGVDKAPKRPSNGDDEPSTSKKALKECMFGAKCYRKNPAHFQEFSHKHLDDILPLWTDDSTLPPDISSEMKANMQVILEQLKILRALSQQHTHKKQKKQVVEPNSPNCAKQIKDVQGKKDAVSESSTKQESSDKRAKLQKMMDEATKHHGDVQAKLDAAAPYYFFLTSITDSPQTHTEPLSITFTELLDKGLGELQCSLQINFMVELGWLLAQYFYTGNRFKPLTLLFGVEDEDLKQRDKLPSNVTAVHVKPPNAFGHHHTKMSILAYTDGSIRVIVSTANLVESDWENRTQGLWISPKLPKLPDDVDTASGESPTHFKADLLRYLGFYRLPQLQEWINRVQHADFSSIRVCFVASVPGTHYGPDSKFWGHLRMSSLLKSHVVNPNISKYPWNSWPVIGQFSSIGTLGGEESTWLCGEFRSSLNAPSAPLQLSSLKLIYPSLNNVRQSHDGLLGGACLPYQRKVHDKQVWLKKFLHCWKSDNRFRSKAMPHIKSYLRVSPDNSLASWFLLTSANLSKAAWGVETKTALPGRGLRILSYEAGVLFLPRFMVDDTVFNLHESGSNSLKDVGTGSRSDYPPFPLHYDLPLKPYNSEDSPWFYDIFNDST